MPGYKLIIFDIDGTIVKHVSSWRYIHEKLGLWDALAHKYQQMFLKGRISYRKFCELDAAHWKGLPEKSVKRIFRKSSYTKNAVLYIKRLKAMGFKLAAVSTGLQYIAARIKDDLGFDYVLCNRLASRKGVLTGKVRINITHGAKGKAVKKILKRMRIRPREMITVGDSAGDIPIARFSGYSIAFNSSDRTLSRIVDYNCRTRDFREVFDKIAKISGSDSPGASGRAKSRSYTKRQG